MAEKAETHISLGDVVVLRSGGPPMTVIDIGKETGAVWCRWMGEGGNTDSASVFPFQAVKIFQGPYFRPL